MAGGDRGVSVVFPDESRISLPFPRDAVALWNINPYCNLECGYCYGSFGGASFKSTGRRPPTLSGRALTRTARRLRERGVVRVYLGGGEPLLRHDFTDVVHSLRNEGLDVMVTTNLTVLPREVLRLVSEGVITRLSVSLDSLDASYNDLVRQGTARVLRNLGDLVEAANSTPDAAEVGLYCVVTRANIPDAGRLLDWAIDHRLGYFSLQPVALPTNHPLHGTLSLSAESIPELHQLLVKLRSARPHLQTSGDVYLGLWEKLLAHGEGAVSPCPAGRFLLYVSEQGEVWRCPAYDVVSREAPLLNVRDIRDIRAGELPVDEVRACSYLSFDCLCMWELMYPQERDVGAADGQANDHEPTPREDGPPGRGGGGTAVGSTSSSG